MFKSILRSSNILKQFIEKSYRQYKHEDLGYISAFLAKQRENQQNIEQIYEELNVLETNEHWEIAKGDHLEQIFNIFDTLHKNSRQKELVINKRYEQLSKITDLIDPDKFPIFSLSDKIHLDEYISLWKFEKGIMDKIEKQLGYSLYQRESTLDHHEAQNGVFLSAKQNQKVNAGTLLGFVPGVIYNSFECENFIKENNIKTNYLQRYDQFIIDFSQKIYYPITLNHTLIDIKHLNQQLQNNQIVQTDPEFINPFAIGHHINHPGPDQPANVICLDLVIPNHFFPQDYQRFMPYLRFSNDSKTQLKEHYHNDSIRGVGVFALREIYDGEELFLDYFHCKLYDMEKRAPDWLLKPPPYAPYLYKHEYEIKFGFFTNLIDNYMANKNLQQYIKFENDVSHDPTIFQKGAIQEQIDKVDKK